MKAPFCKAAIRSAGFLLFSLAWGISFGAEDPAPLPAPVFLADLANPNDFTLFANGGWDGNWYVGYNTCWMQRITVPEGRFRRAFVGAKLGRMKNFQPPGRAPWEKKAYPGSVYISISSTPSWTRQQGYFLAATDDIPLEADFENAVEGVGESRWFWREVPVKLMRPKEDVYLAVWSPTEKMASISSAPILAAGWGTKDVNSWVSHDVRGSAPSNPGKALSTPVTVFEPAIALKLIPEVEPSTAAARPRVRITRVEEGKPRGKSAPPKIVCASVEGNSIERAWVEVSSDSGNWNRAGHFVWGAPYCFTLKMNEVGVGRDGKTWARVEAADALENVGVSEAVNLFEVR